MRKLSIPKNVEDALNVLESCGYRADIVGGCVRDSILLIEPYDFDITTSAEPEEIKAAFKDYRTIDTGIKHGTVTVIFNGEPFEITTYRLDGEYHDSRHPDSVTFTKDIEGDLCRRDFTMNAIAYNPKRGITDLFFGEEDIKQGIIRAVGDPYERFTEDSLRILRGMRFASTFGFKVEDQCAMAMNEKSHLISKVSVERILAEFRKLLSGKNSHDVLVQFKEIVEYIIPELAPLTMTSKCIWDDLSLEERFVYLFLGKGENAYHKALKRMHADNKLISFGCAVLGIISKLPVEDNSKSMGEVCLLGETEELLSAFKIATKNGVASQSQLDFVIDFISEKRPRRVYELEVSGNDLIDLGIKGSRIGEILKELLRLVARGEVLNKKDELLLLASRLFEETAL